MRHAGLLACAITLAWVGLGTATARAGTVVRDAAGNVIYKEDPGDGGNVVEAVFRSDLSAYVFTESGAAPIRAGSGCSQTAATSVSCPGGPLTIDVGLGDDSVTVRDSAAPASGTIRVTAGDGADTIDTTRLASATARVTLEGGAGTDTLTGGPRPETLSGGAGADTMAGGLQRDTASYSERTFGINVTLDDNANDGGIEDRLNVPGPAADNVRSDIEDVIGGGGPDQLSGDGDVNILSGGAGNDGLFGGGGNDTLLGSTGNDVLRGGPGVDVHDGGAGIDTASYSERAATEPVKVTIDDGGNDGTGGGAEKDNVRTSVENVIGGEGADQITATSAANVLTGGGGDDVLTGGGGDDVLNGLAGSDTLDGLAGNDTLDGGTGSDQTNGGPGIDTVTYRGRTSPLVVDLDGVRDDGAGAAESDNASADVENLIGGDNQDSLTGNASANRLEGAAGNDRLSGGDGDDILVGDDFGRVFADELFGGSGDDVLTGGLGPDVMDGGPGSDTVSYAERTAAVTVTLLPARLVPGLNCDDPLEDEERFQCSGDAPPFPNDGDPSALVLDVSQWGGRNCDDPQDDSDRRACFGPEGDRVDEDVGIENVIGGRGDDDIDGGPGPNRIDGGPGGDVMRGDAGVDTVSYEGRTESVIVNLDGNEGDGGVTSDQAQDTVGPGIENLIGGSGDDRLTGNAGANRLVGGRGKDMLFGAGGADVLESSESTAPADPDTDQCGDGVDLAIVDLQDGPAGFPDCESVQQAPVKQHPTVRVRRAARLLVGRRELRVRLDCPRALRRGCRGRLSVALARRTGKVSPALLASRRYVRIAPGRSRVLPLRLSVQAVRLVKARRQVRALALERDPRGKAKRTYRTLAVRLL